MTLLVISPDYASHYGPLAVVASAARAAGRHVVVATGPMLRDRVRVDGFEWRSQMLGAGSNSGIVADDPGIQRFLAATRGGALATLRRQALDREHDLLWKPEQVAAEIRQLCDDVEPDQVLVDHVSFGSTLAMYATGRSFVTLVPGHPSQLPVGTERYGIPADWPAALEPDHFALAELEQLADRVTDAFTARWNQALAAVAPGRPAVDDAFRVHGRRVLYNSHEGHHPRARSAALPADSRFVGPLVRDESLPGEMSSWLDRSDRRPTVYVSLGTFLSHRGDVLGRIAAASRQVGARVAMALGPSSPEALGPVPDGWLVASQLPQVALLRGADIAIHHGGNNSVQESLAAGVRQIVLPFSTDQFATACDLERTMATPVLAPNEMTTADLADAIVMSMQRPRPAAVLAPSPDALVAALFD